MIVPLGRLETPLSSVGLLDVTALAVVGRHLIESDIFPQSVLPVLKISTTSVEADRRFEREGAEIGDGDLRGWEGRRDGTEPLLPKVRVSLLTSFASRYLWYSENVLRLSGSKKDRFGGEDYAVEPKTSRSEQGGRVGWGPKRSSSSENFFSQSRINPRG